MKLKMFTNMKDVHKYLKSTRIWKSSLIQKCREFKIRYANLKKACGMKEGFPKLKKLCEIWAVVFVK